MHVVHYRRHHHFLGRMVMVVVMVSVVVHLRLGRAVVVVVMVVVSRLHDYVGRATVTLVVHLGRRGGAGAYRALGNSHAVAHLHLALVGGFFVEARGQTTTTHVTLNTAQLERTTVRLELPGSTDSTRAQRASGGEL